jgi:hypothetical protein
VRDYHENSHVTHEALEPQACIFMRYRRYRERPLLPHSARSVELIEPLRQLCGYGRYESEAAGGVQEGAEEPARLQAGLLSRCEPGELAELALTWVLGDL